MPGGDDVNAVVLDVGAGNFRAGFAGEDVPRIFQSSTLKYRSDDIRDVNMDAPNRGAPVNLFACEPYADLRETITMDVKSGLVELDREAFSDVIRYSFQSNRGFQFNMSDSPIFLTEPNKHNPKFRKICLETVFEEYDFPAISFMNKSVCSAFSVGKPSGLVIDIGSSMTSIAPVFDGFLMQKPLMEFPQIGGNLLDTILDEIMKKKKANVVPYYGQDLPGVTRAYSEAARLAVVREFKHEYCKLSPTPLTGVPGYVNWNMQPESGTTPCLLPDGTPVDLGMLSQVLPELLFDPAPIRGIPHMSHIAQGFAGIPAAVAECLNSCDVDVRKPVGSDLILTGGSSLFHNFPERLLKAMTPLVGKTKVTASPVSIERSSSAWLGGSILASCATFQQLWTSKAEYEEKGVDVLSRI